MNRDLLLEKIPSQRREVRLSLSALARFVGVSRQTAHAWAYGWWKPRPEHRQKLAEYLGVSVAELFPDDNGGEGQDGPISQG